MVIEVGLSYGEQVGAARKLLRLSQSDLAAKSGVGLATIKRMEKSVGPMTVTGSSIEKVKQTLEKLGVKLIDDQGEIGVIAPKKAVLPDTAGHKPRKAKKR